MGSFFGDSGSPLASRASSPGERTCEALHTALPPRPLPLPDVEPCRPLSQPSPVNGRTHDTCSPPSNGRHHNQDQPPLRYLAPSAPEVKTEFLGEELGKADGVSDGDIGPSVSSSVISTRGKRVRDLGTQSEYKGGRAKRPRLHDRFMADEEIPISVDCIRVTVGDDTFAFRWNRRQRQWKSDQSGADAAEEQLKLYMGTSGKLDMGQVLRILPDFFDITLNLQWLYSIEFQWDSKSARFQGCDMIDGKVFEISWEKMGKVVSDPAKGHSISQAR